MSTDMRNERRDLSMEWVEDRLRALSAVEPPPTLKGRLVADASCAAVAPKKRYIWLWSREARWAGAVAAVIAVASLVGWLGTPLGRQVRSVPQIDNRGWTDAVDYNCLRALDTNSCDTNSLR
jgi:anti-sigma-K factor RskA